MMDVETSKHFVAALEQAAPFDLRVRPWRAEISPGFVRPPGSLPLWLEPDIDYQARIIRFDPAEYDLGAPPLAVLLHELMHLVQMDVLHPHRQTEWLTEAVCDFFAASWVDSPELPLVSARYPTLTRTLEHRLRYPEDVLSQADWVLRILDQLTASELGRRYPDLVDQLRTIAADVSATAPAPHSLGNVIGGAFWEACAVIGRPAAWTSLLSALHDIPRPRHVLAWMDGWVQSARRHVDTGTADAVALVLHGRGLTPISDRRWD